MKEPRKQAHCITKVKLSWGKSQEKKDHNFFVQASYWKKNGEGGVIEISNDLGSSQSRENLCLLFRCLLLALQRGSSQQGMRVIAMAEGGVLLDGFESGALCTPMTGTLRVSKPSREEQKCWMKVADPKRLSVRTRRSRWAWPINGRPDRTTEANVNTWWQGPC